MAEGVSIWSIRRQIAEHALAHPEHAVEIRRQQEAARAKRNIVVGLVLQPSSPAFVGLVSIGRKRDAIVMV